MKIIFSLRLLLCAVNVELFNHLEYWWIINSRNSVETSDNFRKMGKLLNLISGWNLLAFRHSPPLKQGGILLSLCVLALACYLMISELIRLSNDSKWNENRKYEGNVLIYFIIFRVGSTSYWPNFKIHICRNFVTNFFQWWRFWATHILIIKYFSPK